MPSRLMCVRHLARPFWLRHGDAETRPPFAAAYLDKTSGVFGK